MHTVWDNLQQFPWGTRVSMFLIFTGTIFYARAFRLKLINNAWRVMYLFRCIVFGVTTIYIVFLLTGVMGPGDYVTATQWFLPLILFGSNWIPFLHIWEEHDVEKETKGALGGSNFTNTGSRYLKRVLRSSVQPEKGTRGSGLYVRWRSGDRKQDVGSTGTETGRPSITVRKGYRQVKGRTS